ETPFSEAEPPLVEAEPPVAEADAAPAPEFPDFPLGVLLEAEQPEPGPAPAPAPAPPDTDFADGFGAPPPLERREAEVAQVGASMPIVAQLDTVVPVTVRLSRGRVLVTQGHSPDE
ncbi:hypothetical protein ACC691_36740, partial [Rhizobium johnstonii]